MTIKIGPKTFVASKFWCQKYYDRLRPGRYMFCFKDMDGDSKGWDVPGTFSSREQAMNKVFEGYDVLSQTLDLRRVR